MSRGRLGPVVTLDGPAGSGKSTTAKEVARRLGYRHLDSGALYRALTYALVERGVPPETWSRLDAGDIAVLEVSVDPDPSEFRVLVGGRPVDDELRTPVVTEHVAHLAAQPAARAGLLGLQRAAGVAGRLVADGRDMGTVVFPDAEVKVFLIADLEERARRRLRETGSEDPTPEDVARRAQEMHERDRMDSERHISPLRRAEGAHEIDTTALSFEEQVATIVALARDVDAHQAPV